MRGVDFKPKDRKPEEPAWQQAVKNKKSAEYYNKLQELETEQMLREQKVREENHQYAIPGQKVVNKSMAKGMAQKYQESL